MATGRMLNKSTSTDPEFNQMSTDARELFLRTIPHLDRDGLVIGHPARLWAMIDPFHADRLTRMGEYITFASTSEAWFVPLFAFPMCFLQPRTNYYLPCGAKARGVTKGSVVTYLGPNIQRFVYNFANLGAIVIPYDSPIIRLMDTEFGT